MQASLFTVCYEHQFWIWTHGIKLGPLPQEFPKKDDSHLSIYISQWGSVSEHIAPARFNAWNVQLKESQALSTCDVHPACKFVCVFVRKNPYIFILQRTPRFGSYIQLYTYIKEMKLYCTQFVHVLTVTCEQAGAVKYLSVFETLKNCFQ